jgi:hypothetical protein
LSLLVQPLNASSLSYYKLPIIFDFIPFGGSLVSLIPFYNIGIGKYGTGIDVKKSLKLGSTGYPLNVPSLISNTIFSKAGINDLNK